MAGVTAGVSGGSETDMELCVVHKQVSTKGWEWLSSQSS